MMKLGDESSRMGKKWYHYTKKVENSLYVACVGLCIEYRTRYKKSSLPLYPLKRAHNVCDIRKEEQYLMCWKFNIRRSGVVECFQNGIKNPTIPCVIAPEKRNHKAVCSLKTKKNLFQSFFLLYRILRNFGRLDALRTRHPSDGFKFGEGSRHRSQSMPLPIF